jgi:xanthine/uracil permease
MSSAQESPEGRLGRILVGLGLLGFGAENVLFGHYVVARAAPWPADPSTQLAVACVTAALLLASGMALLTQRFVRLAGLVSGGLILGWSLALHLPLALAGPAWGGHWTNVLKAATLASGLFGVAAADGRPLDRPVWALRTVAPYVAGAFFLLCGIQHFMFSSFVATLVPRFIPGAMFWTYFAGVALVAAGLGFWTPPVRRVAATLAAAMVCSWVFLVHLPLVVTVGRGEWMGVFEALAISGVCLVLARWPTARQSVRAQGRDVPLVAAG